ncbi:MAG: hypothetical protein MK137_02080 [Rickettsiales bacterium]|nr:hypothetical protein [Rickettsiales bacterium]
MSDISSVPPATGPFLNNRSPSQQNLILNAPQTIQNLPNGSVLSGTITGSGLLSANNPFYTLNTPQGDVRLATSLPLALGNTLSLRIINSNNQIYASLESLNGQAVQTNKQDKAVRTQEGQPSTNNQITTPPSTTKTTSDFNPRQQSQPVLFSFAPLKDSKSDTHSRNTHTEEAVKVNSTSQDISTKPFISLFSNKNISTLEQAILGSRLLLERFAQQTAPNTSADQASSTNTSSTQPNTAPPSPTASTPKPTLSAASLADISGLQIKINSFTLPSSSTQTPNLTPQSVTIDGTLTPSATNPTAPSSNPVIKGVVTESGVNQLGLQTPLGTLQLTDLNLPKGTEIEFEILSVISNDDIPQLVSTKADKIDAPILQLLKHLDFFKQLLAVPEAKSETQLIRQLLPNVDGPDFLTQLIQFNQATTQNTVALLLSRLQQTDIDADEIRLLDKLRSLIDANHQLSNDSTAKNWQSFILPIIDQNNDIHPIHLFMRPEQYHHHDESEHSESEHDEPNLDEIRFIIEIDLEMSGAMQFDGLYRVDVGDDTTHDKHFDLIIRTKKDLPDYLSQGIANIFSSYMEIGGISGSLIIQQYDSFPVNPRDEIQGYHPHEQHHTLKI